MENAGLPVPVILDLMERLRDELDFKPYEIGALRCTLQWMEAHGLGIPGAAPVADLSAAKLLFTDPDPAEAGAAPDQDPAAPSARAAEGLLPPDDAAPCADAGGGMPGFVHPNAWTTEEDARVIGMKIAGHSNQEIAEAVGRSKDALGYRLSTKLKKRLAAARAEQARNSKTAGKPAPEGGAESRVTAAAQFAEKARAGEADDMERVASPQPAPATSAPQKPIPGSASALAASAEAHRAAKAAPAFDPSRPLWYRQIEVVLDAIGYKGPWTPARGRKVAEIAADMRLDPGAVKARFVAMTPDGRPGIDDQRRLLEVLRDRALRVREAAE